MANNVYEIGSDNVTEYYKILGGSGKRIPIKVAKPKSKEVKNG